MFRSLPIVLAAAVTVLGALASLPGTAAAETGRECLELVSVAAPACTTTPGDDDDARALLCEPAALMSLGDASVGHLLSGSVSGSVSGSFSGSVSGSVSVAEATTETASAVVELGSIRVCPPGPMPAGHTCHVRAPYDAPPDQGGGAQAPSFDPWIPLPINDSTMPDPGRRVTVLAPQAAVRPGYARGLDRPPPVVAA